MNRTLALSIAAALILAGCKGGPIGQSATKATADALNACVSASSDHSAMLDAAASRAISPSYAAAAKTAAETCHASRLTLMKLDPVHPCLPPVQYFETMNWALASAFEGKQDIGTSAMTMSQPDMGDGVACAKAWGATPEQLKDIAGG